MSGSEYASPSGYHRPTTRGELRDRLARGETCEVVSSNASITSMMIRGWLQFDGFMVRQSENDGWSIFEPDASTILGKAMNIVKERRSRGAVCAVCKSPDYTMEPPIDGETIKPTFKCKQCGRSWSYGYDGGVYAELATPK